MTWARDRLSADLGRRLRPAPPLPRFAVPDHLGWHEQGDGRWLLGLHVRAGRVGDMDGTAFLQRQKQVMLDQIRTGLAVLKA